MKSLEAKLVRREKSYRRARVGCIALAILTLAGMLMVMAMDPSDKVFIASSAVQVLFWLALAYAAHARVEHVATIKAKQTPGHETQEAKPAS